MSDDLYDDLTGVGDLPDPAHDPTAALLRAVLVREADRVQPAADGLARIRAAVAAEQGTGRGSKRSGRRSWLTVVAAAASVVVLAGAALFVTQNLSMFHKSGPASPKLKIADPAKVPVYEVGSLQRDGRMQYRLFREYVGTSQRTTDGRLSDALTNAVSRRPEDPDYSRIFGGAGGARVTASWDAATRTASVELTPAMTTVRLASDERAFAAIQQIVYTATAVVGDSDAAVRITVRKPALNTYMFGRQSYALDQKFYRAHGVADPTAPVLLVDPAEGADLGRGVSTIQVNVGYTARDGVVWTLTRDGRKVGGGTAAVGFAKGRDLAVPGNRGIAEITVDHSLPGTYELVVSEPPSAGTPPWTDSRTFVAN